MRSDMRTNNEIGEWLHIEEMKYHNTYDKDKLMEQSIYAIAFVSRKTPREIKAIYTKYRQSAIGI